MEKEEEKVFKAKIKADVLKGIINTTHHLVNEIKLNLSPNGVGLRAVDPAHVAMVDIEVKKNCFEEYKASEMELGVDVDKINSILKMATGEEIIMLEYDEDNNRLVMKIGNLVRKMGLIDTAGMPDAKMPKLELPARVVIKSSELNKGVKGAETIIDYVALNVDKDCFKLYAEGDTDTVELKLTKKQLVELETKSEKNCKSLFSLDYLSNVVKNMSGNITIFLGNDNPAKFEFDIAEHCHVVYLLAPRIESE